MIAGADLEMFERSVARAVEGRSGAALDRELAVLGWTDALSSDPARAVAVLFRLQGRANATSSALQKVLAAALTGDPMAGPVVLPAPGSDDPPGRVVDGRVEVEGCTVGAPGDSQAALVPVAGDQVVRVPLPDIDFVAVKGIDPDFGLHRISGRAPADIIEEAPWASALGHGRLALAQEMTGAARQMLDLACGHALQRVQFGRPIASFQAVRHRLAETLVAIEAADAVLADAWEAPDGARPVVAKALAGRAARTAGRHCQQVLAGIGFTAEHPFHRYLRRTMLIDQLLGSSASLTEQIGTILIRTGRLPDTPAL